MSPPPLPRRAVTVADVARLAGVSKASAARVLGGYGLVSTDLSARVLAAAERLDYRPNELARTMATGRSGTVGVVVGDIENPFFGLVVRGISDAAKTLGFGVILSNSGEDPEEERAALAMLMGKRVDGLVVAPASMHDGDHLRDAAGRRGLPLVLVDREVDGLALDAALSDDEAAARRATRLLLEAGHRRIAYLTATESDDPRYLGPSQIALTTVLGRIKGLIGAGREAGLSEPERFIRLGATGGAAAEAILAELLALPDRPTAILASDSKLALEVFRAAKTHGLLIPRDLSLVTFDDAAWMSALSPAVTVLAQPSYELGREAMHMLAERIGGRREVRRRVFEATLIERETVSPPPAR